MLCRARPFDSEIVNSYKSIKTPFKGRGNDPMSFLLESFRMNIKDLPYSYSPGNNPCGDGSRYYCHDCGLEIHDEEVGFVAAGWTDGGDTEWSKCPQCGEENSVFRVDDDC